VTHNKAYDLSAVTRAVPDDGGVLHGRLLIEFAEAALGEDEEALKHARAALKAAIGPTGLVDAAAVVGLFNAIDRVADATGIPLEAEKLEASADFRAALGVDRYGVDARV
jgi:hypothetical protein